MRIVEIGEIRRRLEWGEVIGRMREAVIAGARGECDMPMPMHLEIAPENAEVHIKSSYRRGGPYFALKIAGSFPGNAARGLSTSSGMMLLSSAETGEPVALLADGGYLTDVRTAAVAAMMARELERPDEIIGILGTGVQGRLQAQMHALVLDLVQIVIWGRTPQHAAECQRDLECLFPAADVILAHSPAEVARAARLIITCTASRQPLLNAADLQPGTLISAVGSDSPGKQELDPEILRRAGLVLVDSLVQCEKLGELQHAPEVRNRAIEIGAFCNGKSGPFSKQFHDAREAWSRTHDGMITVCDFTGLGVEDLYIAEYCFQRGG